LLSVFYIPDIARNQEHLPKTSPEGFRFLDLLSQGHRYSGIRDTHSGLF